MPNVFHPKIFEIFKYLKKNRRNLKIVIYSNNTGTPKWANMLKKYIEYKIGGKLFDKVITAWKVGGKIYQKCRTTENKTYNDILKCAKISKRSKIYFVDDYHHPGMIHKNVTYNHIKKWMFGYDIKKIVEKYVETKHCNNLSSEEKDDLIVDIPKYVARINWGKVKYRNDFKKERGTLLFKDIKNFITKSKQTRKKRKGQKNKTKKY